MKSIRIIYSVLFVTLTFLWLLADNFFSTSFEFFPLRSSLVNYTGVLAMGAMSVAMILALRPFAIESLLNGMDKSYRLHKWLGITALVVSVIHWLWAVVPKWLVGWAMLAKPAGGARVDRSQFVEWMTSQRSLAEALGEWAFYATVVLILLALIKRFPYRHFFKTHRVLAIVYLILVYHSIILMKSEYWLSALGMVMALLMVLGSIAAILSLTGAIGYKKRAVGTIDELDYYQDNRVLRVVVHLRDRWVHHQAGQFAFATFDSKEGAHPFTLSSSWNPDGRLSFLIKELGDYTRTLPSVLKSGQAVTIEGPYGCFDFSGPQQRQIWIAGGIGITPFMARMQALIVQPDGCTIDLWYSTAEPASDFIERLTQLAEQAGVRLHVLITERDCRLTTDKLCAEVPDWRDASLWFCGPGAFGRALREGLVERGFDKQYFHQELFDMR